MKTRERILMTTLDLYNELGVYNVSSRVICKEMNISPGNFSYHFPSMSRLVTELFGRYVEKISSLSQDTDSITDYVYEKFKFMKIQYDYRFLFLNLFDITQKHEGIKDLLLIKDQEQLQTEKKLLNQLSNNFYLKAKLSEQQLNSLATTNMRAFRSWLVEAMLYEDNDALDLRPYLSYCIQAVLALLSLKGIREIKQTGIMV